MNTKEQIELLDSQRKELIAQGAKARETNNFKELKTITDKIMEKKNEIENLKKFDEMEKSVVAKGSEVGSDVKMHTDGFKAMVKAINSRGKFKNDLITGGTNGEDLLVPEDVQLKINELRKSYKSAKDIVNVVTVTTLSGSYNWEDPSNHNHVYLQDFEDGGTIATSGQPKFIRKDWKIKFKGEIIPISRILEGAEQADLMVYLNRWFVRKAVITENHDIFETLKAGYNDGTAKALTSVDDLKTVCNVDLDPSVWIDGAIVTNTEGFDYLDHLKDENGLYILQPDPKNPTQKLLFGKQVIVYSKEDLPTVSGNYPFFIGSTKAAVNFREYKYLTFETSSDFLFNKNQLALKVMEGYTVESADTTAYVYALLTPAATAAA